MSAFGGKVDMLFCMHMSAFDPKRTSYSKSVPLHACGKERGAHSFAKIWNA